MKQKREHVNPKAQLTIANSMYQTHWFSLLEEFLMANAGSYSPSQLLEKDIHEGHDCIWCQ